MPLELTDQMRLSDSKSDWKLQKSIFAEFVLKDLIRHVFVSLSNVQRQWVGMVNRHVCFVSSCLTQT